MDAAQAGDTVQVHYTGRLEDGTVFDRSEGRPPLEFTLGVDRVIPGLEKAVEGLSVGQRVSVRVPPLEAYGPRSDDLVMTVARDRLPASVEPRVGMQFEMSTPSGYKMPVRVTHTSDRDVQVDANHPLAGEVLFLDLELVKIV